MCLEAASNVFQNRLWCPYCHRPYSLPSLSKNSVFENYISTDENENGYPISQIAYEHCFYGSCPDCEEYFRVTIGYSRYNRYTPPLCCSDKRNTYLLATFNSDYYFNYSFFMTEFPNGRPKSIYYIMCEGIDYPIFIPKDQVNDLLKYHKKALDYLQNNV